MYVFRNSFNNKKLIWSWNQIKYLQKRIPKLNYSYKNSYKKQNTVVRIALRNSLIVNSCSQTRLGGHPSWNVQVAITAPCRNLAGSRSSIFRLFPRQWIHACAVVLFLIMALNQLKVSLNDQRSCCVLALHVLLNSFCIKFSAFSDFDF